MPSRLACSSATRTEEQKRRALHAEKTREPSLLHKIIPEPANPEEATYAIGIDTNTLLG
jgi:hypothetical protein